MVGRADKLCDFAVLEAGGYLGNQDVAFAERTEASASGLGSAGFGWRDYRGVGANPDFSPVVGKRPSSVA